MNNKKATGVVLNKDIITSLDKIKKECIDLGVTRSEIINNILIIFFNNKIENKIEKLRKMIIKNRKQQIK